MNVQKVDGGSEVRAITEDEDSASKIFVPDGSDVDPNALRIEDGASIANSVTASYLNYSGEIQSVGLSKHVFLGDGLTQEQAGSLIISMPIPDKLASNLALGQSANLSTLSLVVFYHIKSTADGFSIFGLIPPSKISLGESELSFALRGSGNYQAAWVTQNATEELTAKTEEAPKLKSEIPQNEPIIPSASPVSLNCPANFVKVPADTSTEVNTPEFCVMKYEAKDVVVDKIHVATSQIDVSPWSRIARGNNATVAGSALKACSDLGTNYSLISNAQWQAIARNIETAQNPPGNYLNWSNGSIAEANVINRGHSDNAPPSPLVASTDDDPCSGTEQTNCADNTHADFSQKRTHTLSNGEIIWDFAGNVWESVKDDSTFSYGPTTFVTAKVLDSATPVLVQTAQVLRVHPKMCLDLQVTIHRKSMESMADWDGH